MAMDTSIAQYSEAERAEFEHGAMSAFAMGVSNADMFDELGDAGFDEPQVADAETILNEFIYKDEEIVGKRRYRVTVTLIDEVHC